MAHSLLDARCCVDCISCFGWLLSPNSTKMACTALTQKVQGCFTAAAQAARCRCGAWGCTASCTGAYSATAGSRLRSPRAGQDVKE